MAIHRLTGATRRDYGNGSRGPKGVVHSLIPYESHESVDTEEFLGAGGGAVRSTGIGPLKRCWNERHGTTAWVGDEVAWVMNSW